MEVLKSLTGQYYISTPKNLAAYAKSSDLTFIQRHYLILYSKAAPRTILGIILYHRVLVDGGLAKDTDGEDPSHLLKLVLVPQNVGCTHVSQRNCTSMCLENHPRVSFKEDVDPRLGFCSNDKLAEKLKELIKIYCQNLLHA